ncbi:MarR family winged helix-turn-helix transcriptional regulator [Rhodococcus sp. NPDC003318]|uniref:MarR family winged helix-turn-helix transcriptional regulator n=1 Tax=Rhodococcus sp. NPDC003318 TaxID=3364503 RepID=UPI0036911AD7
MATPDDSTTPNDSEARLRRVLAELVTNASRLTRLASSLAADNRPRPWMRALSLLEEYGALRVSELARLDTISQPTATAVIKQLGEAGLVERQRDPNDSRAVVVVMTDAGRDWLEESRDHVGATLSGHLPGLDADRVRRLSRSLEDLREVLKESSRPL